MGLLGRSGWQVTFDEVCALEPRVAELRDEVLALTAKHGSDEERCANAMWYGLGDFPGIKPRLKRLVGWGRRGTEIEALGGTHAYDVAYQTLYNLLPSCKGGVLCGCA